jgi:uncharacterized protein (TIGR00299 family) protein
MGKILWLNPASGISGDMLLGALMDIGVSSQYITTQLNSYGINNFEIKQVSIQNQGIMTSRAEIILGSNQKHFSGQQLLNVAKSIDNQKIRNISVAAIEEIISAEAKIHGIDKKILQLHELGELDTLIDIVGVAIAIAFLEITIVYSQPIAIGLGNITTNHGVLPATAPITMKILEDFPVFATKIQGETITPTGASLLKALNTKFDITNSFKINKTGYGSVTKNLANSSNFLQIAIAEEIANDNHQSIYFLETNLDDVSGELLGFLINKVLEDGALDCWISNGIGKKNRPIYILHVLCEISKKDYFEKLILSETGSLGIRKSIIERTIVDRNFSSVVISDQIIRIKHGPWQSKPEYEDLVAASLVLKMPILTLSKIAMNIFSNNKNV